MDSDNQRRQISSKFDDPAEMVKYLEGLENGGETVAEFEQALTRLASKGHMRPEGAPVFEVLSLKKGTESVASFNLPKNEYVGC